MSRGNGKGSSRGRSSRNQDRSSRGTEEIVTDRRVNNEGYDLKWFKPNREQRIVPGAVDNNWFTVVTGDSGSGKTSTAIWKALSDLDRGLFDRLIFIKTPSEVGDDPQGFLPGDEEQKLEAHIGETKEIFERFMSPAKFKMEIKTTEKRPAKIVFKVPNFLQGATFPNTIVIVDEAQNISPKYLKLITERVGKDSTYILLGDSQQTYSAKKRADGLAVLLDLAEKDGDSEGYLEHIELKTIERSVGSAYISRLFKGFEG